MKDEDNELTVKRENNEEKMVANLSELPFDASVSKRVDANPFKPKLIM